MSGLVLAPCLPEKASYNLTLLKIIKIYIPAQNNGSEFFNES
jgi:hypothetical protein